MSKALLAATLMAALAATACDDGGSKGTAGNYSTPATLCNAAFNAMCQQLTVCGATATAADACDFLSGADWNCEAQFTRMMSGLSIDSAKLDACLATLSTQCGNDLGTCEEALIPGLNDGDTCTDSPQCPGYCAKDDPDACTGTCAPDRKEGEVCRDAGQGIDAECEAGLECGLGGQCVAVPAEGEACSDGCGGSLYCVDGTCLNYQQTVALCPAHEPHEICAIVSEECVAGGGCTVDYILQVPLGKSCDQQGAPAPRVCQFGSFCDPGTKLCTAYLATGATCFEANQLLGFCEGGSGCDFDTGKCEPAPGQGEDCTGECETPWVCREGKCTSMGKTGEWCDDDSHCESLRCDTAENKCLAEC